MSSSKNHSGHGKRSNGYVYIRSSLSEYEDILARRTSINNFKIKELKEDPKLLQELNDQEHIVGGIVVSSRLMTTKKK